MNGFDDFDTQLQSDEFSAEYEWLCDEREAVEGGEDYWLDFSYEDRFDILD